MAWSTCARRISKILKRLAAEEMTRFLTAYAPAQLPVEA